MGESTNPRSKRRLTPSLPPWVFTDADTGPTVDAAHLLGRIQGRELAERETPAEGAVLNESSAG